MSGAMAGRRVLVTGGGSGTGADLARGFAEAGAEVVIAGRREGPLHEVAGRLANVRAVVADVTDEGSVAALFDAAGPCDVVIANAGAGESAPLARTTRAQWDAAIAVNLTGTFLTFREGLARMTGWGRLIAVASVAGLRGSRYTAAYSAAKHGVVGLVRCTALEVARRPVTANAVCPGFLDTGMTDRTVANVAARTGQSEAAARAALAAMSPQDRLIAPAEVTATALWLCAPGAEGVNGQAIALTGGDA